ncbi:MAG: hypothetical protein ACM34K_08045 [Bacillota bacterium]
MKKILTVILYLMFYSINNGQFLYYPETNQGNISGGFGRTWINGAPFNAFHFRPEVSFSKIGVGLDLNLEFDANGKLNKENFNEFSDYLSIIRYVRYGVKTEPFYVRLGALDYATLGHGSIMYMYNNSPSYDVRKIGLEFDWDMDKIGFESVYGNFGESGLAGLRGFVRPFKFTELSEVPVISNFELGASFVEDFNKYSGVTSARLNDSTKEVMVLKDQGRIKVIGLDLGLPIGIGEYFKITPYFDYAKIVNFGSGTSLGLMFNFQGLGIVSAGAKIERRFNGDRYLPSYFNSLYEIERFRLKSGNSASRSSNDKYISKAERLDSLRSSGNGVYGELLLRILNTFDILGSYQRLDNDAESGILHLVTDLSPKDGAYVARAGYDKIRIKNEKDIFTLDDRSYLFAEVGYKPIPYLLVSLVYNWTFEPKRDNNDNVISFEPQKKIETRLSLVYPFNFGGN